MNFLVTVLNWLALRRPRAAPAGASAKAKLLECHLAIILNPGRLADEWATADHVRFSDLGRMAVKLGHVEELYRQLHHQAWGTLVALSPYARPIPDRGHHRFPGYSHRDPGTYPVGRVKGASVEAAKDIEPDKLTFKGPPGFDPVPYFDPEPARAYSDPASDHLPGPHVPPPRVRLRGSQGTLMAFFKKLDSCGRLRLFPAGAGDPSDANGGFNVAKDLLRDRFVMDGRRSNRKHRGRCRWTRFMAFASSLLGLHIPWGQAALMSADDSQDFYYDFKVSEGRCVKNIFIGRWSSHLFRDFQCYRPELARHSTVMLALSTLAQGDLDAVAFGQAAHVALLWRAGILRQEEIITMRGRFPHTSYTSVVIIATTIAQCSWTLPLG